MLYTPHAIVGASIAYTFPNMLISIPLSIISHLFFDVFPHSNPNPKKAKGITKALIFAEIILGNVLLLFIAYNLSNGNPYIFSNIFICGIAANLPDYLTFPYAILKKDIFYSKKISNFQSLVQNHVNGKWGYSLQIAVLVVLLSFYLK